MIKTMLVLGVLAILSMVVSAIGLLASGGAMVWIIPAGIGMIMGAIVVLIASVR